MEDKEKMEEPKFFVKVSNSYYMNSKKYMEYVTNML